MTGNLSIQASVLIRNPLIVLEFIQEYFNLYRAFKKNA